jgi:hypothetical protein
MRDIAIDLTGPPLNDFVAELGLDRLPFPEREKVLTSIAGSIFEGALVRILEEMGEVKGAALDAALDAAPSGDPEALVRTLREHVPGLDQALAEEASAFRLDAVATMRE